MALTITASGTVANSDLASLNVTRTAGGDLVGTVTYSVNVLGEVRTRTATWTLSAAEKTLIVSGAALAGGLLTGARAAIAADLGL